VRTLVRLGLDNPSDLFAFWTGMNQMHAKQLAGNDQGFSGVEGTGQLGGHGAIINGSSTTNWLHIGAAAIKMQPSGCQSRAMEV
jgi:hypothetical protein